MLSGGNEMFAKIVRGIDPVRASIGLDDVTGAFVRGVLLTIESESGAGAMNPAGNTEAESVRKRIASSRIKREPVSRSIGLGVRSTVRQPVRAHVAHATESYKNYFLHAWAAPVGGFRYLPVSPETGFLTLNGNSSRSGSSPVAGISSIIQHFLKGLHTVEIMNGR
jgi:hypothetical protein